MVSIVKTVKETLKGMYKVNINNLDLKPKPDITSSKYNLAYNPKQHYDMIASKYNDILLGYTNRIVTDSALANISLKKEGKKINNDFSYKLQYQISRNATFSNFIKEMMTGYILDSNSYAIIVWKDGVRGMDKFEGIIPISKDNVEVKINSLTDEVYYELKNVGDGKKNVLYAHNMVHLKNLTLDGLTGIDIFKEIVSTNGMSNALDNSVIRKLNQKTLPYAVSSKADVPTDLNDLERRALYATYEDLMKEGYTEEELNESIDMDKVGAVATVEANYKGVDKAVSEDSLLIYDSNLMSLVPINNDPHLFDPIYIERVIKQRFESLLNLPVGYSNIEIGTTGYKDIRGEYLKYTINPRLKDLEDELTRKLLTKAEILDGYTISIEIDSKYELSPEAKTERAIKSFRGGLYSQNDALESLGNERREDPLADVYWISQDMQPLDVRYKESFSGIEGEKEDGVDDT